MYRGFNLKAGMNDFSSEHFKSYELNFDSSTKKIQSSLDKYLNTNGSIDASKMELDWFPEVKPNVFISHSHKDQKLTKTLAGWLYDNFKITSFIDSTVWGYSDELLLEIDRKFCKKPENGNYDYDKRNRSTSHVHMLLSVAIMKMMDSCEMVIFLNTPSSISAEDAVKDETTSSPWIYAELAMTKLLREKDLFSHRDMMKKGKYESLAKNSKDFALNVHYKADLKHLTEINISHLEKWEERGFDVADPYEALNLFYKLNPSKG